MKQGVRSGIARARKPFGQRALKKLITETQPPYRIMIGASRTFADGWISTDVSWRARYYLDATKPWPVPIGSVSHVYADNVIEHLTLAQARLFLEHASDALMATGKIRLVTPDIRGLATLYLDGPTELRTEVLERSRAQGLVAEHDVDLLRVPFTEHGHHRGYLWDADALAAELRTAGFDVITFPEVLQSTDPTLRDLESRRDAASRISQLVVEASKTSATLPN